MDEDKARQNALYEMFLATAEKVSDRRAQANTYLLSVNSAIVGLHGYLQEGKASVGAVGKPVWLWAIPAAGIVVCLAWAALLASYRQLNRAKFAVLMEMEAELPLKPFSRERQIYRSARRIPLSWIESAVPCGFVLLYAAMIAATLLKP
jgi:hypothetical protein